jgi:hypothetical protein
MEEQHVAQEEEKKQNELQQKESLKREQMTVPLTNGKNGKRITIAILAHGGESNEMFKKSRVQHVLMLYRAMYSCLAIGYFEDTYRELQKLESSPNVPIFEFQNTCVSNRNNQKKLLQSSFTRQPERFTIQYQQRQDCAIHKPLFNRVYQFKPNKLISKDDFEAYKLLNLPGKLPKTPGDTDTFGFYYGIYVIETIDNKGHTERSITNLFHNVNVLLDPMPRFKPIESRNKTISHISIELVSSLQDNFLKLDTIIGILSNHYNEIHIIDPNCRYVEESALELVKRKLKRQNTLDIQRFQRDPDVDVDTLGKKQRKKSKRVSKRKARKSI